MAKGRLQVRLLNLSFPREDSLFNREKGIGEWRWLIANKPKYEISYIRIGNKIINLEKNKNSLIEKLR